MKKLLRLTILALLLTGTVTSTVAQFDDPPPTCDPANPDCKPIPPGLA